MDGADHDLLVQIHTKLERALVDLKELKDDTSSRVEKVENDLSGLGRRVSSLENWRWYVVGISVGVATIIGLGFNFLNNK